MIIIFPSLGKAYVPPVGIPAPDFGIEEKRTDYYTRPAPWDQEAPGWYYVDQYHANASDANAYGTPENPRRTIPDPVPAGSVVEVHGLYDYAPTGYDLITANGTEQAPVFIVGSGQTVVKRKWAIKSSYTIIENIEFTDFGKISITYPSHHVAIRNNNMHHINGKIGGYGNSDMERLHHIVIYNNKIHSQEGWDQNPEIDLDNHGIKFGRYVEDVWIVDNLAYNNGGSFVQVGDWNSPANNELARRYYIGRNTAYANRQSPIGVKQSSDVIISENLLYNNRAIQTNAAGQAGVVFQYGPERLWIINNRIFDSDAGISSGSNSGGIGQEQFIVGNLIYNIHTADDFNYNPGSAWSPAAIMLAGGVNRHVIDNTIHDVDAGISCPGSGSLDIRGNIVSHVTKSSHVFIEHGSIAYFSSMHNNILYQRGGDASIRWGDGEILNVAGFEFEYPAQGQGNLEADPLFINPSSNNFFLQSSSPAIDRNTENDVYQIFQNLYGIDIRVDNDGDMRPQGAGWDIGALESSCSAVTTNTWTGAGNWSDASRWSLNGAPARCNHVVVESGSTIHLRSGESGLAYSLEIQAGAVLSVESNAVLSVAVK
ncbi:choice-of-anchor Q domain-containing protein [Thiolapillus sp.]